MKSLVRLQRTSFAGYLRILLAMSLILALGLLFGCSAKSQIAKEKEAKKLSLSEIAMLEGNERQSILEAGAREEGRVVLYTSMQEHDAGPIVETFTKKYPFLKVELYRAGAAEVIRKFMLESQGGKNAADVIETTGFDVGKAALENLLAPFTTPISQEYSSDAVSKDNLWVSTRQNFIVMGYNTQMVTGNDIPQTYEDLLQPKWKGGKIAVETEDHFWMAALWDYWGEQKAKDFFYKLGQQDLVPRKGHAVMTEMLVAGEVPIAVTAYSHTTESQKAKGAPVEWKVLDPAVAFPIVVSLSKQAPNPHAAMLFIDFILSKEGQEVISSRKRIPAHPEVPANPPRLNTGFNYVVAEPELVNRINELMETYKSLVLPPRL